MSYNLLTCMVERWDVFGQNKVCEKRFIAANRREGQKQPSRVSLKATFLSLTFSLPKQHYIGGFSVSSQCFSFSTSLHHLSGIAPLSLSPSPSHLIPSRRVLFWVPNHFLVTFPATFPASFQSKGLFIIWIRYQFSLCLTLGRIRLSLQGI